MAPQQAIGGWNSRLPDDIIQDTGVLYIANAVMAATRGGVSFDPGKQLRNTPYDGQKARTKGLDRTVGWEPVFKAKIIQLGETEVPRIEPGVTHTGSTGHRVYTPLAAGLYLASGDYITDFRVIFARTGGGFVELNFPIALIRKYSIQGVDKQEGETDIEVEAIQDLSSTSEGACPFRINTLSAITS